MLTDFGPDRVRTLRVVGAPRDPLALRHGIERTLGAADLRPRGLSPSVIVCIRRLRVPMPRWEESAGAWQLDAEVRALLPGAARPFAGRVPASAWAIVFADEAELLACLARDWLSGEGGSWWWRALFGEPASEELVRSLLAAAPAFVPAALDLLARAGLAVDLAASLPPSYCERLGDVVAAGFGVSAWAEAQHERASRAGPGGAELTDSDASQQVRSLESVMGGLPRSHEFAALAPPQRALLGLALLLRRAPGRARTAVAADWLGECWHTRPVATSSGREPAARGAILSSNAPAAPAGGAAPRSKAGDQEVRPPPTAPDGRPRPRPVPAGADSPWMVSDGAEFAAPAPHAEPPLPRMPSATAEVSGVRSAETVEPPAAAPLATPGAEQCFTSADSDFAGVLYLVNLALRLELYGDFTQPARPNLALPLGDFLAMVGESSCGPALRDDPLWALLAELAGRDPAEAAGRGFVAPAGTLARWLAELIAALEARAALALDIAAGGALPFLCRRPGRVTLTATRLDAIFPLATHPFAIRFGGLDRNPGWVPAAGRVIEFHYE
jgi:hypothetical protein